MIHALHRFGAELRRVGLAISPAEWLEALRAVECVGLEDRARFRQALRATLVKRAASRAAFDSAFERFFAAPRLGGRRRRRRAGAGGTGLAARGRSGPPPESAVPGRRPEREPRKERRVDCAALARGDVARQARLRHVVTAAPPATGRGSAAGTERRAGPRVSAQLRARMAVAEERELAREVRRVVARLRLRSARRVRATRSGRPYLRRVFRESLRSGGVPFTLPRRRPRRGTPRVVLLVDVSWSTARAAGVFLEIAGEFLRLGRQTRVLLFVDRAVDATAALARWLERRPRPPFPTLLEQLGELNLSAPSDYGRAFHQLLASRARPRGRRTVLVVLGDGRTNRFAPLDWAFGEIAERCGTVLWLVPEPLARWGQDDSALPLYLGHADVAVEAGDLAGLARGVAHVLRRIG